MKAVLGCLGLTLLAVLVAGLCILTAIATWPIRIICYIALIAVLVGVDIGIGLLD